MESPFVAPDGTVYFRDSERPQLLPGEFMAHRKYALPSKEDVEQV
jgi:hypothetical protein